VGNVCDGAAFDRERRLWDAYQAGSREQLEALIEEAASDVGPTGALDRGAMIDAVGRMRIESYALSEMRVRKLGDVEVVTYRSRVEGTYEGKPFPAPDVYATTVCRRTGGRWREAHRQETPARW
jgi:hypothetical protein